MISTKPLSHSLWVWIYPIKQFEEIGKKIIQYDEIFKYLREKNVKKAQGLKISWEKNQTFFKSSDII